MAVDYHYSCNKQEHKVEQEDEDEEDYIDMEVSSFAHFFPLSNNTLTSSSPHHNLEFEFQMSSSSSNSINIEQQSTTSPADELFYMGKLLPLHLPPRLQMVEKLLQDSTPKFFNHPNNNNNDNNEFYTTPFGTNTATTPETGQTPFESCNVSPSESCQISREIHPDEYDQKGFFQFDDNNNEIKKSWTRKLKTKIKALFWKTGEVGSVSSSCGNKTKRENKDEKISVDEVKEVKIYHRRSFSGAFKRRSSTTTTKLSSSYSSSSSSTSSSINGGSNPNGLKELLKRSSSANSEIETSLIQGAIAHCKQSSEKAKIRSRKTLSEAGCHSFPSSRFAALNHETSLCRG